MVKMIDQFFDHKIMLKKFWFGKQKFKKAKKKNDKLILKYTYKLSWNCSCTTEKKLWFICLLIFHSSKS